MNITRENIDELNAILKVEITKDDYQDKIDKQIKELQKKANVPGFRPGKVPTGMIVKMYGKGVMLDEINKVAYESIDTYIKENNIEILGSPIPNMEKTKPIDLENQSNFEFYYDFGIKPKVNIDLANITVDNYNIIIDEDAISKRIERYCKTYSERTNAEISEEEDVLIGEFNELDEAKEIKVGGINNKSSILVSKVNEKVRKNFLGVKVNDSVKFNIVEAFENSTDLAYMLGVKKEEVEKIKSDFKFTITEIARYKASEINQQLFDKIYGDGLVTTEEQFKEKVKENIADSYKIDTDQKFMHDAIDKIIETTTLNLPDEFLKKFIRANNENITDEILNAEYDKYARSLKWQIIEAELAKQNNVEVKKEDIEGYIKQYIQMQWMYMQKEATEDEIQKIISSVMSNQEEVEKIYTKLLDDKFLEIFKEKMKLDNKEIAYDDYVKLVNEHTH